MDKKTSFKEFVKKNPSLVRYVKNNEMTWQKFFEMYDLYGEDENVWQEYTSRKEAAVVEKAAAPLALADIVTWVKNMDLDKMQEGINSVQRVIGVIQELGTGNKDVTKPEYKPRPLYKHFED